MILFTIIIVALLLIWFALTVILKKAPEGYEDALGFHYGPPPHEAVPQNSFPDLDDEFNYSDLDEFDLDDDDPGDVCGYYCLCCGHTQGDDFECEVCMGQAFDEIYF